jgi:hypothetical protein
MRGGDKHHANSGRQFDEAIIQVAEQRRQREQQGEDLEHAHDKFGRRNEKKIGCWCTERIMKRKSFFNSKDLDRKLIRYIR